MANKNDLETANWVLRDRLGKPNQTKELWSGALPRTQAEFDILITDAKKVAEENKGKYLPQEIAEFESLLSEYYNRTPSAQLGALRNEASNTAATATIATLSSVGHTVPGALTQPAEVQNGVKEIKEALAEINPENLEKAITTSEKFINLLSGGDTKNTLRGVHGAIIFQILRDAGHNLIMQNGQITIIPKPGTDVVNLQEKLQTLVNTKAISLDTIKLGMLYSSPSFKAYAENKKRKDANGKDIIDPIASPQDFMTYLRDLDKAGNKSGDIETILKSQSLLSGVNMQQAIKGFQDMGQVAEWKKNNEEILSQVETQLAAVASITPAAPQSAPSKSVTPAEQNTTLTGKLTQDGVTGGHVTGVVGDSTKGLIHGIGDILSLGKGDPIATLAIGGGLVYGIYKAFQKFGFLGGLGTLFGLGAMNNIDKILGRFGVGTVSEAVDKAGKKASEIADAAKDKIGGGTTDTPAKAETKVDEPKENPLQKKASNTIRNNDEFKKLLDSTKLASKTQYKEGMETYITFMNQDLSGVKLSVFLKKGNSIFEKDAPLDPTIKVPAGCDPEILKSMLRTYLTGKYISKFKLEEKENKDAVVNMVNKIKGTDLTLSEAITKIHQ